jgi:hypothetical protein
MLHWISVNYVLLDLKQAIQNVDSEGRNYLRIPWKATEAFTGIFNSC